MVKSVKTIGIVMSEKYLPQWEEFSKLVRTDKVFKDTMKKLWTTDKRSKNGSHLSASIRYVISRYIRDEKMRRVNSIILADEEDLMKKLNEED